MTRLAMIFAKKQVTYAAVARRGHLQPRTIRLIATGAARGHRPLGPLGSSAGSSQPDETATPWWLLTSRSGAEPPGLISPLAFEWSGEDGDRPTADLGRNLVLQGFNAHVERQQTSRTNPV